MLDYKAVLAWAARDVLKILAGILVAHGYLDGSGVSEFIAAGMVFASVGWTWWLKSGQRLVLARLAKTHGIASPLASTADAAKAAVQQAAKATALVLLAVMIGSMGAPAARAQAIVKTPDPATATAVCNVTLCEGFYIGGNLVNSGANFDVIGSGLNGLAANGIMFGAQAGYEFWNGQVFAALEGNVEYAITSNMPNVGSGNSAQYALGAQVKLGYSLASLFGAGTTGAATPTLPSSLANALVSPYIAIGIWDRPWGVGLATGAGVQALIATNWTLDAEYLHINYNNAAVNPLVSEQTENLFLLSLNRHF